MNQFIERHFRQMDSTLKLIDIACASTGRLVQSIQIMDQLKKLAAVSGSVPATQKQYSMATATKTLEPPPAYQPVQVFNDKAEN